MTEYGRPDIEEDSPRTKKSPLSRLRGLTDKLRSPRDRYDPTVSQEERLLVARKLLDTANAVFADVSSFDPASLSSAAEITPSSEGYTKVSGPKGSNEGGWYLEAGSGQEYYIKYYEEPARAYVEYIACELYKMAGIPVPEVKLQTIGGRLAILSKKIQGAEPLSSGEMAHHPDVSRGFVMDALLSNWDSVGSAYDNIVGAADGRAYRIDNGGALIFRARGERKQFRGNRFVELSSMRDDRYPAGRVFNKITDKEIVRQAQDLLLALDLNHIQSILNTVGIEAQLATEIFTGLQERMTFLHQWVKEQSSAESTAYHLEQIGNPNIIATWGEPQRQGVHYSEFSPPREIQLRRNDAILIENASSLTASSVLDALVLKHRKPENFRGSIGMDGWDSEGAYSKIYIFDGNRWLTIGSSSRKFAEPRPEGNPEEEIVHDIVALVGKVLPKAILIVGDGDGERGVVAVSGLRIDTMPNEGSAQLEHIFSPGVRFVDVKAGAVEASYGGGTRDSMGIYPHSIPLNCPDLRAVSEKFPITTEGADLHLEMSGNRSGSLFVEIKKPTPMERIEVAVGDTEDWGGKVYKRGETFRRGHAKLSIFVRTQEGKTISILDNANVPPRGILKGSPSSRLLLQPGDQIKIVSDRDTSYLMGLRIQ